MKQRFRKVVSVALLTLAELVCGVLLSISAHAGAPCVQDPICSVFARTPLIFRGKVVGVSALPPSTLLVENLPSSISLAGRLRVRFQVAEVFKGNSTSDATVIIDLDSESAFPFKNGTEYVVFAYQDEETGEFFTSTCTHTHEFDPTKDDPDTTWMRGFASAPSGSSVFGYLRLLLAQESKPFTRAQVSIRGAENHDILPDQRGMYSITGLPPGDYTVSATVPVGFVTNHSMTISLADKACAEVDWPIHYDGHIGGRVVDSSGSSISHLAMTLSYRDSNAPDGYGTTGLVITDAEGRYDFEGLSPGEYFVVANSLGPSPKTPYPRLYYPNADTIETATAVQLGASETLPNVDIMMPVAWKPVRMEARVVLSDGSPAAHAEVAAFDTSAVWSSLPAVAKTDENGKAMITVYEGRSYYLTSLIGGIAHQSCGGPLKFTAQNGIKLDPVRIEHDWGNCLAQLDPGFVPPR